MRCVYYTLGGILLEAFAASQIAEIKIARKLDFLFGVSPGDFEEENAAEREVI